MTDSEFLSWLRDRLIYVYGESPSVDFVLRLGEIIEKLELQEIQKKHFNDTLQEMKEKFENDPTRKTHLRCPCIFRMGGW